MQYNKNTPVDDGYTHLQPQATDAERAVLGALMIDKDAYTVVCDLLRPESFYDDKHKLIYRAVQELELAGTPVDIITVTDQLDCDGTLEKAGGAVYISDLSASVTSAANIERHARIVAEKSLKREFIIFSGRVSSRAFDETMDIDDLMQQTEGELFELSQHNMRKDYTQIDPVIKSAVEVIQRAAANKGGLTGVPSGFHKLDAITCGWQASDLIIVAARPAMGKTSFALSMARYMAVDRRIPTAFFSLEMSNVQLINRILSNTCEIEGSKILSGQLREDEWKRLDSRVASLLGAPLYLDDTAGLSVFELRTKARRLVREYGIKVLMVDYLQLMNGGNMRFASRQEEVSTISRSLKNLAKELDIPVIALSQLNRGVENREGREGKRPLLSDLRESGAIEQDADMVLFVHRPEYYKIYADENGRDLHGMAQIIIAKHRKGATGEVLLAFRSVYTRFENPEDRRPSGQDDGGGEIIGSRAGGYGTVPWNDGDMA